MDATPRKCSTNEQIAFAIRQAENGATVDAVCRTMGVSEPTFYCWKKQFVVMAGTSGCLNEDDFLEIGALQTGTLAGRPFDTMGFVVTTQAITALSLQNIQLAQALSVSTVRSRAGR